MRGAATPVALNLAGAVVTNLTVAINLAVAINLTGALQLGISQLNFDDGPGRVLEIFDGAHSKDSADFGAN